MPKSSERSGNDGTSSDPRRVWAAYSYYPEDEDFIVGTRAGLQRLKEHIEIAIENGEALIEKDVDLIFAGVRVVEAPPAKPADSAGERVAYFGCIGIILFLLASCVIGLWTIAHWTVF